MALRIERIDLTPWGCFENHTLPFSPRVGDVDLIHGRNASGKSTTSRGERSLLYGIDNRTVDNHTFDYADLRIGARVNLDGRTFELSRRKRRVGSLVGPNGETLPDDLLTTALGGLTGDVYTGLFQVDNETLVRGGEDLLQGQGEVGASLFAAAAGIASLHRTLADLEAEADRWFNPRGRASELHKRLAALREAERRLRETTLRPARHREMTRALGDDEQACEEATRQLRELDLKMREIDRNRAVAPLLAAREELVEELASLAGTPELPEDAAARRIDADGRIRSGKRSLERAVKALSVLDQEIAAIVVDAALLARAEEITAVKDNVAAISKAVADQRKREGELQEARASVSLAATTVGADASELESLRRPIAARRALDACLREREELRSALRGSDTRREQAARDRDDAEAALAAAPSAVDVSPVEAALAAALKAGSIGEQRDELELEATQARREATERLGQLSPSPSSVDELRSLAAPSREEAARAAAQLQELQRESETLDVEARRLEVEEADLEEERRRLELEGEAPSAEALADARARRGAQWAEIRSAGSERALVDDECDAFEGALAQADHLADRRTDHAAQIERTAAVHARAAKLQRERAEHQRRRDDLREREAAAAAAWVATWSSTQLRLVQPDDAAAWLDEREAIVGLARAADAAHEHAERLREREGRLVDALVAELRRVEHEVAAEMMLDAVVARAQHVVAEARTAAVARASRETELAAAERASALAERGFDAASAACAALETEWPRRRAEAGLPEATTPEAAQETARAIDGGLSQLAKVSDLERRIAGIDADTREFVSAVGALCTQLAPDLSVLAPLRAAAALGTRFTKHESAQARRDTLLGQRATKAAEVSVIEREIAGAEAEVDELLALAGVDDAHKLPTLEARAERVRVLRQEIADAERRVAEVGEAQFAELAALAVGFDRDQAAIDVEELRATAEELRAQRDEIKEHIGERRRELADAETDVAAVDAAQDVALARAAVQEAAVSHAKGEARGCRCPPRDRALPRAASGSAATSRE